MEYNVFDDLRDQDNSSGNYSEPLLILEAINYSNSLLRYTTSYERTQWKVLILDIQIWA